MAPPSLLAGQAQLIAPADLPRLGASTDFTDQFAPRPLLVTILAGGVLGAMTWQWQKVGDSAQSAAIASEAGAPWSYGLPDPGFGTLTFSDGVYVAGTTYVVSSTGTVTPGVGAYAGLTAVRFDARQDACVEVTSLAVTWMLPRVVPPVKSVGPQIFGWLGDLVIYRLRSRQGMTTPEAGAGDENVRLRAVAAEKNLKEIGISEDRPPDIVDSSTGNLGAGLSAYPIGDTLRGW